MIEYYISTICFAIGIGVGIAATIIGFKLGFKASYEIRNHQETSTEGTGLFKPKKDPGEFELVDEGEEVNKE